MCQGLKPIDVENADKAYGGFEYDTLIDSGKAKGRGGIRVYACNNSHFRSDQST